MARQNQSTASKDRPHHFEFGLWLRELRAAKGLVLREVAAAVAMDMAHLSKIELGDRLPTPEQTTRLARFYEIPVFEMEAARVAGKFLRDLRDNPAAARVLEIVQESAAAFGAQTNGKKIKA